MNYKYDEKKRCLIDIDTGKVLITLAAGECSYKFLCMAGKEMANKLNTIGRTQRITNEKNNVQT